MADFKTKKPKIRNGLDERKTQPKWRTLARERRNQKWRTFRQRNEKYEMGLTKKDATNMADFQKRQRNQKYEMGLAKDPTKNEVDFDEKDATKMWWT